jgi:hypothetical protein
VLVNFSLTKFFNGKHFPVKEKFGLVSRKIFFFYFGLKTHGFRNIKHVSGDRVESPNGGKYNKGLLRCSMEA